MLLQNDLHLHLERKIMNTKQQDKRTHFTSKENNSYVVNFVGPAEGEKSGINTIDKRTNEKRKGRWLTTQECTKTRKG